MNSNQTIGLIVVATVLYMVFKPKDTTAHITTVTPTATSTASFDPTAPWNQGGSA